MHIGSEIKNNTCKNCAHWHGRSNCGDCYWVIGELEPKLFGMKSNNGFYFQLPFDPHDVKYYSKSRQFLTMYNNLKQCQLPEGVSRVDFKECDIKFDDNNDNKKCITRLTFFRTDSTYGCKYFKEKT